MDPAIAAAVAAVAVAAINMIGSVLLALIKAYWQRSETCRDATIAAVSGKPPNEGK